MLQSIKRLFVDDGIDYHEILSTIADEKSLRDNNLDSSSLNDDNLTLTEDSKTDKENLNPTNSFENEDKIKLNKKNCSSLTQLNDNFLIAKIDEMNKKKLDNKKDTKYF